MTWKLSDETAAVRNDEKSFGDVDGKFEVGPTSLTWIGTVSFRERIEAVVGGGRRFDERDFFKAEVRWRKVSFVA